MIKLGRSQLVLGALLVVSAGFNFGLARTVINRETTPEKTARPETDRESGWRRESVRERLDLAPEQADALEEYRARIRRELPPLWEEMRQARRALMEETRRPVPDKAEIERLVSERARLHAEIERLAIGQVIEARKHLDEEQWESIDSLLRRDSVPRRLRLPEREDGLPGNEVSSADAEHGDSPVRNRRRAP